MSNPNNLQPGGARTNCTGCCTTCGRHFISDAAFDMHRHGKFEQTTESGKVLSHNTRHCVDPEIVSQLEYFKGKCPRQPHVEVIIWKRKRYSEGQEDPS